MSEPAAPTSVAPEPLRFSLLQIIAVTTSVAAVIALCYVLMSPPLGSSGLLEATIPACVLAVALWFSRRDLVARFGTYAVVAPLLSLYFLWTYIGRSDWLFGHTRGPPQLIFATCCSAAIGALAGIAWLANVIDARRSVAAPASPATGEQPPVRGLFAITAIVVVTLVSGLLAVLSFFGLPQAAKELDPYVERRLRDERRSILELANATSRSWSPKRPEIAEIMATKFAKPSDEAAIPVLRKLMRDRNPRVRRAATTTLRHVTSQALNSGRGRRIDPATKAAWARGLEDDDERVRVQAALAILEQNQIQFDDQEARLLAITVLGSAKGPETVDEAVPWLLFALEDYQHEAARKEAVRSLGRIGPQFGDSRAHGTRRAVFRLTQEIERLNPPFLKTEAAESLGAMGPAAKGAVPSFGRAWNSRLLTVEQARALYKIDPEAAERFQIPREGADTRPPVRLPPGVPPVRGAATIIPPVANAMDDPQQLADRVRNLNDDDPAIRREGAMAVYAALQFPNRFKKLPPSVVGDVIAATKRPEPQVVGAALTVLRFLGPSAAEAVPALVEILKGPPSPKHHNRIRAMYALGELGPAAVEAVPRLSEMLSADTESQERSAAAKTLGMIGAAAKPAVPAFREAWEKHLLTSDDAQALYRIDVNAAEELKIPAPPSGSVK